MISHSIHQVQSSCNIILIIFYRFCHRLSNCFQSCEMNDSLYRFLLKNVVHSIFIADICVIKYYFFSGDLFYTIQCLFAGIVQIINNNNLISFIQQFHTCMASDIAGTACYQNSHFFTLHKNPSVYRSDNFLSVTVHLQLLCSSTVYHHVDHNSINFQSYLVQNCTPKIIWHDQASSPQLS